MLAGRKIRVQITCGGGGKGENREKKLQERITKFRRGRKTKSKLRKAKSKQNDNSLSDISTDKMQMSEDPQDDTQVNINN